MLRSTPAVTSAMDRREFLKAGITSAVSCATLTACAQQYVTLRYRLRIIVDVDGQQYEGASVIETEIADRRGTWWLPPEAPQLVFNSRGDAVVIDLREHGLLFGLLVRPEFHDGFAAGNAFDILSSFLPRDQATDLDSSLRNVLRLEGEFQLREADQPTLVRFRDISDPTTAKSVDAGRFAEIYGAGASSQRATISVTSDPITRGIDKVLPWLANADDRGTGKLRIVRPQMTVAQLLSVRNFKADGS